jgi:hypothetical protein
MGKIKDEFIRVLQLDTEDLLSSIKEGIQLREILAKNCAEQDYLVLNVPEPQLREMYEELFFSMAMDDTVSVVANCPREKRWKIANIVKEFYC